MIDFKFALKICKNPEKFTNYIVAEGFKVYDALSNSKLYRLVNCFITNNNLNNFDRYYLDKDNMEIISKADMLKITSMSTPPGIIGIFEQNKNYFKIKNIDSTFILYNISDPGNMGTLIRTAVALNRKEIIIIDGCYYYSQKVIQSSSGTIGYINILSLSWKEFLEKRIKEIPIYALDASGENINSINTNELNICYILIGNESNGIPEDIIKECNRKISIPMSDQCESLNAAIAGSIAGYKSWKI